MKPKITVISFPWESQAPYKFLSDILKILDSISDDIRLIDGNTNRISKEFKFKAIDVGVKMHYINSVHPRVYSAILWVIKCFIVQIKTSFELFRARDTDIVLFYTAYPYYLLPLITANLLGKTTVEIITRSKPQSKLFKILALQDPLLFRLLSGFSPESPFLVNELNLNRYEDKILVEGSRFIDTDNFRIVKKMDERDNIVGYVGRLEKEKGILEFLEASSHLNHAENVNLKFLIIGNGKLKAAVEKEIFENSLEDKIEIIGWVPNETLPQYLNKLKLLVLPTVHAEGLPTIILESMACGCPVLSTNIGGILDIITDEETGFIMDNNSPETIYENVLRALNSPNLGKIISNARNLMESKYNYESAVERYNKIIGAF